MLGERIRKLRKQKKMTLESLAGQELTKGMLSLIENNKANPSMESLTYIAEQLGVEVSDLLEEISTEDLRNTLENAEVIFNTDLQEMEEKYKQLIALIGPYVDNLSQGYEAARLLEIYSRSLFHEKQSGWQEPFDKAAKMYDQMNLTAKRASIGIFRAMMKFTEHDYSNSLKILLSERSMIESNHVYIDPMTRIDFDYHESILYFAVGDSESAIRVMEKAITYSRENKIFYHINDLYRLAAAQAMMSHDEQKKDYYLEKLRQYGEFADDPNSHLFYELISIMSLISEKQDFKKALKMIERILVSPEKTDPFMPWFLLEKGKALYFLDHYEEAINCFQNVKIPTFIHHPFDLSIFYVLDSYKALSFLELGNLQDALTLARKAVENFNPLPHSPFKQFSLETYDSVKKIAE